MLTVLVVVLRVIEAAAGLACFYLCLLYEDQEKRVQNKLAEVWVWICDDRSHASYVNRYMQACALLSDQALTRIFGRQLFSLRSMGVSLSYSVASYLSVMFFSRQTPETIAWTAGCLVSGTLAVTFPNRYASLLGVTVPGAFVVQRIAALSNLPVGLENSLVSSGSFAMAMLVAAALDCGWIALNRSLIRRAVETHWMIPMAAVLVTSAALLLSPFIPFTRHPFSDSVYSSLLSYNLALGVAIVLSTRIFLALAAGIFFLSMISLLLYWCFGSLLARLVYAAERHSVIRARKPLALVGVTLLVSATTDSGSFHWVAEITSFLAKIVRG